MAMNCSCRISCISSTYLPSSSGHVNYRHTYLTTYYPRSYLKSPKASRSQFHSFLISRHNPIHKPCIQIRPHLHNPPLPFLQRPSTTPSIRLIIPVLTPRLSLIHHLHRAPLFAFPAPDNVSDDLAHRRRGIHNGPQTGECCGPEGGGAVVGPAEGGSGLHCPFCARL